MRLRQLFTDIPEADDADVVGLTDDSQAVEPGYVYVAIRGDRYDGHDFAAAAVARGAVAVVAERPLAVSVPCIVVGGSPEELSRLAADLYGRPSESLAVTGVTGTKGKTTTSAMTHHLLVSAGQPAGLICTAGTRRGAGELRPLNLPLSRAPVLTTPKAPVLQRLLAEMRDGGLTRVVVETSSHALATKRVEHVRFRYAVWTQLTPEHLDYHHDIESYFQAKAQLVRRADMAVLNLDCAFARRLLDAPHVSYGRDARAEYRILSARVDEDGVDLELSWHGGPPLRCRVPVIGPFNAYNAAAALAAAHLQGCELAASARAMADYPGVPGRMQQVLRAPFRVIVDFAHTPESLAAALDALRPITSGRLVVVVGAAGGRFRENRPRMGRAAVERADLTLFTQDDAHGEPLASILELLEAGARDAGAAGHWRRVPDRREAIGEAIAGARAGDTILLAGKGHELSLDTGEGIIPWSDAEEARAALAARGIA